MKRALVAALGAAALIACGTHTDPPRGGLLLTLANDGSLQLDTLKVQVASGDTILFQNDFQIPQTPLPNTLSIVSNGSGTTAATITVSGWLGGVAVDRRDAIVTQIPSDREAALEIVLSAQCTPLVNPQTAASTCPAGQTCSLDGGTAHCASADVDASKLPDYGGGTGTGSSEPGGGSNGGGAACVENALQCNSLQPQKCIGGTWRDQGAACSFDCAAGACTGECVPGTTKCDAGGVSTCGMDSKWAVAVACPASTPACNGNGVCGVCVAGSKQCSDTSSTQTCNATGQWEAPTACADPSPDCNGAGQCGACHATDTRCISNTTVETCGANGAWGTATPCTNACVSGACTGVCTPGATQCVGTTEQTCNGVGSWVNDPVTAGTCGAVCTPPSTRCVGTTPQTCNAAGGWQSGAVTAGTCGATCTPGATSCSGTLTVTCGANGTPGAGTVVPGSCGAVCTPSTHQCSGASYETCTSVGLWDGGVVLAGQCGAVCTPNTKACSNTDRGGTLSTNSWWVWTTEAIYDSTCNGTGQWGPANQCTGKCAGTDGNSYYNCDTTPGHNGCIAAGVTCSSH